jgi:hypothetical protein
MRYIIVLFLLVIASGTASGQEKQALDFKKNNVKLNLFALPLKTFSLQYERGLNENISVSLGVRLQPKSGIPFKSSFTNDLDPVDDSSAITFINSARLSNWAITPEFRYYFGKRPLNGFYVAPYARFSGNTLSEGRYPFTSDGKPLNLVFHGKVSGISGGLMLGSQWHLKKNLLIDWWIVGLSWGSYKINLDAAADLTSLDQEDRDALEKSLQSLSIQGNKTTAKVSDNGVTIENKLSLPGVRAGLCIGYTF